MTYTKDSIEFVPLPTNPRFIDRTNIVYERLTVLGFAGKVNKQSHWWCECECASITKVNGSALGKRIKSCGCYGRAVATTSRTIHGASRRGKVIPEYNVYYAAKARCDSSQSPAYKDYGERGIEFRFTSFSEFLATVGLRPTNKHQLERVDNDGHYEPDNCEWKLRKDQVRNRRSNQWLTVDNKTLCIADWAIERNIPTARLYARKHLKWCDECIVMLPKKSRCPHI